MHGQWNITYPFGQNRHKVFHGTLFRSHCASLFDLVQHSEPLWTAKICSEKQICHHEQEFLSLFRAGHRKIKTRDKRSSFEWMMNEKRGLALIGPSWISVVLLWCISECLRWVSYLCCQNKGHKDSVTQWPLHSLHKCYPPHLRH